MRKVIIAAAVLALLWCGWWWAASSTLQNGTRAWFEARGSEGWQAELGAVTGGGFPTRLQANLSDIALADPQAGLAIRTATLGISTPTHWPGDVTVRLDEGPIVLASPVGRSTLTMREGVMALNLHPGTALELEALGWTAQDWQVEDASGTQMQADSLTLTMTQTDGPTYDFEARADAFAPGDATRAQLRLPDTFPRAFDSLTMRATVTFDKAWDRRTLDTARPQPRRIALHLAEARWGDLNLNFAGDMVVDAGGIPDGTLSIQAENWRTMLDFAQVSGALPPALRNQAETILRVLAEASGNPDTLDVDLTLRDGAIYLGFLPIAPAPRLIIR
ncbi:DUF2125 domain-containing protein [uncultured Tateyamaria sp.]|uniref:DUF2125 domain-containing protein n=1 Tax=uncultured Tateyamaria sp. TaxID=455651 RepID=UPI0026288522|nr:DUF2125 domain-containing protein [uncultured Tateyamaria sp.]